MNVLSPIQIQAHLSYLHLYIAVSMFLSRIQFLCSRWKLHFYSTYNRKQFLTPFNPPKTSSFTHLQSVTVSKRSYRAMLLDFRYFRCRNVHRYYCVSAPYDMSNVHSAQQKLARRNYFPRDLVLEIIDRIKNNDEDLVSRLDVVASSLSFHMVIEIFRVLNSQRVSGLSFFEWISSNLPQLSKNARVCSLVIDNQGRLEDYQSMLVLLKKFTSNNVCLTYEAFTFLSVSSSLQDSTKRVVELLNEARGSCRNSGVRALIEMLCKVGLLEMASYVIGITESRESYYFILICEKCRRGLIEDARRTIKEMEEANCPLSTRVYNCILGSLYKNGRMEEGLKLPDEMKEIGVAPDAITFEIIIRILCVTGNIDGVHNIIDGMVSKGVEPRLETHTAILKSLCAAEQYEAAHKYVAESAIICKKTPVNTLYSLLAKLYLEKDNIMGAHYTLVEMMDKGIKPNSCIYTKIVKRLLWTGRNDIGRDLEYRHSQFLPSL